MPRILALNDLEKAKQEIGFLWTWEPGQLPPKKIVGKSHRAYFELTCSGCNNKSWVEWGSLKQGRNRCCSKCANMPTLDEMYSIVEKYGMMLKPSLIHKVDPKTRRRLFRMTCRCGNHRWIRWNHFQQGMLRACNSCGTRLAKSKTLNPFMSSRHPVRKAWYYMQRQSRESGNLILWQDYEAFKGWSLSLSGGFKEGAKFRRRDPKKPFAPDNCVWETVVIHTSRDTGRNTVNVNYGHFSA